MANQLSNVAKTEFDMMVKQAYQEGGLHLRNTVRTRMNVVGDTVKFPKMGEIVSYEASFGDNATVQNPTFSNATATLKKYLAPVAVDNIQEITVNFDARSELAQSVGMSMERRDDQVIIDGLVASGTSNTIANGGTNLTYEKVLTTVEFFRNSNVPLRDITFLISPSGESQLLTEVEFIDNNYLRADFIKNGTLDNAFIMGMNWKVVGPMTEGGLTKTGNIRTCWAYAKSSMGYASGKNIDTLINYIALSDSTLVNGRLYAGSVAVDAAGIVKVDIDETA